MTYNRNHAILAKRKMFQSNHGKSHPMCPSMLLFPNNDCRCYAFFSFSCCVILLGRGEIARSERTRISKAFGRRSHDVQVGWLLLTLEKWNWKRAGTTRHDLPCKYERCTYELMTDDWLSSSFQAQKKKKGVPAWPEVRYLLIYVRRPARVIFWWAFMVMITWSLNAISLAELNGRAF